MKTYSYEDLQEIVKALRSENGCPWDRVQTHDSLRPCMMEEAAEVLAAIRILNQTGECDNLREELGDVLLQVVMHATIAEEEKLFTMDEVVSEIAEKMVRRHPHVFTEDGKLLSTEDKAEGKHLPNWEEIKKQEKAGKKTGQTPLKEIPMELPALTRGTKVFKKTDKLYGDKKEPVQIFESLAESLENLKKTEASCYNEEMSGHLGNMLMELCRLSAMYKLSPEQILTDEIQQYIESYEGR